MDSNENRSCYDDGSAKKCLHVQAVVTPADLSPPADRAPLPPLRSAPGGGGVTPAQRRAVVVAIAALHGLAGWAALQVPAVREALHEAAPMFVDLIAPPTPKPAKPPEPPPPPPPRPIPKQAPPPAPLITAAPSPTPPVFAAPPPPEAPVPPAPPIAVVEAPAVPPAPPPPPAPALPKEIPASMVEYLVLPAVEYPRLSIRANERGVVVVRVLVGATGQPLEVLVGKSSGFARLDEAAVAGVRKARFKPPTENGKPISGWASIPIPFELEK